jgi:hypothetical protein
MTAYDLRARASAARMLKPVSQGGKGQAVTITTPASGTFNAATDTATGGSAATQTGSGVEVEYDARSIDGTTVRMGDKQFLLSPLKADGNPITKPVADRDTLTLADGSVWLIKRVETLAPTGTPVLYTLQLRGAG